MTSYTSTKSYFESLNKDSVESDLQLLSIADENDFFDLVVTNPMHYISILEHSNIKLENSPFIIRRVLNNLFVKFQMGIPPKIIDIGFMDNNTTDKETLEELKISITLWRDYTNDEMSNARREIARMGCDEFENGKEIIKEQIKESINVQIKNTSTKIPLPEFNFPKISEEDRKKAGYSSKDKMPDVPEYLKFNTHSDKVQPPNLPTTSNPPSNSSSNPSSNPPSNSSSSLNPPSNSSSNPSSTSSSNPLSTSNQSESSLTQKDNLLKHNNVLNSTTSSYIENGYLYLITTTGTKVQLN
jgi:hypothetical protein